MTTWLWSLATSDGAIAFDLALLAVAIVVGHAPLIGRVPAMVPYVMVARLAVYFLLAVLMTCLGYRWADESAALRQAQVDLSFTRLQLETQRQTADVAAKLRAAAEAEAAAANEKVTDYETWLESRPDECGCALDADDVRRLRDIAR